MDERQTTLPWSGARHGGLASKIRRALWALRQGDFAGLARGLGRLLRRSFARPSPTVPYEEALQQLAASRATRPLPELAELRNRVLAFLPAASARVSVIVLSDDAGRPGLAMVDSLRRQNHPNLEVVVVSDGSSVTATGEFLLCMHDDCVVTPECVALLAAHLHAHPDCAFAFPSQHFSGDGGLLAGPQADNAWDLLWADHAAACTLVRRAAWPNDDRAADGGHAESADWERRITMSVRGQLGVAVPVPMYERRHHGQTVAASNTGIDGGAAGRSRLLARHGAAYAPPALAERKRRWRPTVSVVIPFADAHRWWHETYASLQRQTLTDFEIVLVNDASHTPESRQLLDALRSGGKVRVIDRPTRGGAAAARNTGVLAAESEFVFLLDADDLLAPLALEQLVWLLLASPELGFVYPGVAHFGDQTGVCLDAYDAQRLRHENYLTCAALLRREVYLQAGGMAEQPAAMHEDWDFWLRLASLGIAGKLLPEPLFFYRRHATGRSAAVHAKMRNREMRALLRQRNPVVFGDAKVPPVPSPLSEPLSSQDMSGLDQLTADLRERYRLLRRVPNVAPRRANLPNPLPAEAWADARVHVLFLVPYRRRGEGQQLLTRLRSLDRERCHSTVVIAQAHAAAWAEQAAPLAAEAFQLAHVAPKAPVALAFLEYLLMSRNVDVLCDLGTAPGGELITLVQRRYSQVRVLQTSMVPGTTIEALTALAHGCDRHARLREFQDRLLQGGLLLPYEPTVAPDGPAATVATGCT